MSETDEARVDLDMERDGEVVEQLSMTEKDTFTTKIDTGRWTFDVKKLSGDNDRVVLNLLKGGDVQRSMALSEGDSFTLPTSEGVRAGEWTIEVWAVEQAVSTYEAEQ